MARVFLLSATPQRTANKLAAPRGAKQVRSFTLEPKISLVSHTLLFLSDATKERLFDNTQ